MVTHETYQDADGKWLYPNEIHKVDGKWVTTDGDKPVTAGAITKMSKSKKNTVDPQDIIDTYGADAARFFILSDSPPERDLEWSEAGIEGAWRYINKTHRMVIDAIADMTDKDAGKPKSFSEDATELRTQTHKTVAAVADDIDAFHMNKSVARIRELSNAIADFKPQSDDEKWAYREAIEALVQLFAPMMPHLAEELWSELGHNTLVTETPWPTPDKSLLASDTLTIGVQVNGKVRATITFPQDADENTVKEIALSEPGVQKAVNDKEIRKFIYVPGRIVNVVVG